VATAAAHAETPARSYRALNKEPMPASPCQLKVRLADLGGTLSPGSHDRIR